MKALAASPGQFDPFFSLYDSIMKKSEHLTLAEKEMIAVVVSAVNRCVYCLAAHGAILRIRAKHPYISDQIASNFRKCDLISSKQKAMLAFAELLAGNQNHQVSSQDIAGLCGAGVERDAIWEIVSVVSIFSMSNRLANALSLQPNPEFYSLGRDIQVDAALESQESALNSPLDFRMEEGIYTITLNNPESRNPLSSEVLQELHYKLKQAALDSQIKVFVLKSTGTVFSSGHNLKEVKGLADGDQEEELNSLFSLCAELAQSIRQIPQPVVAVTNGVATAAGLQLISACDIIIASDKAQFSASGINLGLFCTTPGVELVRNVPLKVAMEMLCVGEPQTSQRMKEQGLVNHVFPEDRLQQEAMKIVRRIAKNGDVVSKYGKKTVYQQSAEHDIAEAYKIAVPKMAANTLYPQTREKVNVFLNRPKSK
jgi:uncharacterized peroxidase-related enzyme